MRASSRICTVSPFTPGTNRSVRLGQNGGVERARLRSLRTSPRIYFPGGA